jgi:Carboxypeptidase regulatory-like domain
MLASYQKSRLATLLLMLLVSVLSAYAQSGSSTSITGTVVDPSGAVVSNATVEVRNPVSGFVRTAVTDTAGVFVIPNVPFNPYHLTVAGNWHGSRPLRPLSNL